MSVSFPLLFTVVRLWAPHVVRSETGKKQPNLALHRCVFMDGGLCSNFPIHLFDSALPAWPTFGASLHDVVKKRGFQGKYMGSDIGAEVFLPTDDDAGRAEWQYDFDVAPKPSGRLAGLVGAVLATVKDWNDATTARLPGVWDRVVRIRLQTGEGGLNISMPGKTILRVAHKGVIAGRLLLDRFSDADSPERLRRRLERTPLDSPESAARGAETPPRRRRLVIGARSPRRSNGGADSALARGAPSPAGGQAHEGPGRGAWTRARCAGAGRTCVEHV